MPRDGSRHVLELPFQWSQLPVVNAVRVRLLLAP